MRQEKEPTKEATGDSGKREWARQHIFGRKEGRKEAREREEAAV